VHRVGYALNLPFQGFVQPARRRGGLVKSAMLHLIGRKALLKKNAVPGPDHLRRTHRLRAGQYLRDPVAACAGQIRWAPTLLQCSARDFITASQGGLAAHRHTPRTPSSKLTSVRLFYPFGYFCSHSSAPCQETHNEHQWNAVPSRSAAPAGCPPRATVHHRQRDEGCDARADLRRKHPGLLS
jgi:hypothetical protein